MFEPNSLITRIAVGKVIGFIIGLAGFLILPMLMPEATWQLRLGILLWYTTVGAVIGMFGVINWHPILRLPLPWWVRAPGVGAWMNFVLVLFAWDTMAAFLTTAFGADGALSSPYWFVLEGALVGLLIGYTATRLGGEGPGIADTGRPDKP